MLFAHVLPTSRTECTQVHPLTPYLSIPTSACFDHRFATFTRSSSNHTKVPSPQQQAFSTSYASASHSSLSSHHMRRGIDPPALSSKPSSSNSGLRELPATRGRRPVDGLSARAPRGPVEQPQSSLQRTLESQPQPLPPPDARPAASETPWRSKSPSYLKGKNPYGRILDDVEHPYRKPRTQAPGPPSQLGSNVGGRSRTSGSFKFTTRSTPPHASEGNASVDESPTPPLSSPKRPSQKTYSVKDAKSLFETKASESGNRPLFPPEQAAVAKAASVDPKQKQRQSKVAPGMQITGTNEKPTREGRTTRESSSPSLHLPTRPAETTERRQSSRRSGSSTEPVTDGAKPEVVVRAATVAETEQRPVRRRKSPGRSTEVAEQTRSESSYAANTSASTGPKSTNLGIDPIQKALLSRSGERSGTQYKQFGHPSTGLGRSITDTKQPAPESLSDKTVRRRSVRKSFTTETEKARQSADSERASKTTCPQTSHAVRRIAEQFDRTRTSGCRKIGSQEDAITERPARRIVSLRQHRPPKEPENHVDNSVGRCRRELTMSEPYAPNNSIETYVRNFGEPVHAAEQLEEIAGKSLSHDGSGSDHSFERRGATQLLDLNANVGTEEAYHSIEVPHHVDWRGGYGRRRTQDFGFPGARIKPHSVPRTYKAPLQDPGNWIKRACGHFSTVSAVELHEEAVKKVCSQCRGLPPSLSIPPKRHRSRKRSAIDSSASNSRSSRKMTDCYRQHYTACDLGNKCGDSFAQELGYIIDSILEEHQNTLQCVIKNIKSSQPSLAQLRRVSEDLVNRCQPVDSCTGSCRNAVRGHVCQPCEPVSSSHRPCLSRHVQPSEQVCD